MNQDPKIVSSWCHIWNTTFLKWVRQLLGCVYCGNKCYHLDTIFSTRSSADDPFALSWHTITMTLIKDIVSVLFLQPQPHFQQIFTTQQIVQQHLLVEHTQQHRIPDLLLLPTHTFKANRDSNGCKFHMCYCCGDVRHQLPWSLPPPKSSGYTPRLHVRTLRPTPSASWEIFLNTGISSVAQTLTR